MALSGWTTERLYSADGKHSNFEGHVMICHVWGKAMLMLLLLVMLHCGFTYSSLYPLLQQSWRNWLDTLATQWQRFEYPTSLQAHTTPQRSSQVKKQNKTIHAMQFFLDLCGSPKLPFIFKIPQNPKSECKEYHGHLWDALQRNPTIGRIGSPCGFFIVRPRRQNAWSNHVMADETNHWMGMSWGYHENTELWPTNSHILV